MSLWQGLSNYKGLLVAAWKGEVGDDRLFYSQFNGSLWSPQGMIPGNSSSGPALAVLGNSLYAMWKGEGTDQRLFYSAFNGVLWSPQALVPNVASSLGPSLAVFGNKLYAAWKGMDADQGIYYASFDGSNWSPQAGIPGVASSIGPSLASYDGRLYAAWKGSNNDQSLWFASFDGSNWSGQAQIPGAASSVGPSLVVYGKLYAAWKGESGDQTIWYSSFDGSNWAPQTAIAGVASSIGPVLATEMAPDPLTKFSQVKLFAMWKGEGADQTLWYSSFNGTTWAPQSAIPGNTGQDLPQNIGLRMQYQETNQWCWIAVATSINYFYNPQSTATQCGIMTTIGQNINQFPSNTSACPSSLVLLSHPSVEAILANPYQPAAENVLNDPTLGIPVEYIKSGGVGDALNVHNNANGTGQATLPLALVTSELAAGRPLAIDIAWTSGGQHVIAIAGVLDDQLLICDPVYGESVIAFESFPALYQSGASLVWVNPTQAGT